MLEQCREQNAKFFTSEALLAELIEVLSRPKFAQRLAIAGITVDDLVSQYAEAVIVISPNPVESVAPDPDDDIVLGPATAAIADMIITGDRGLLSMGRYGETRILTVADASKRLAEQKGR